MRRSISVGICLAVAAALFAQDMPLLQILIDKEDWQPVALEVESITGLASDADGNVFVADGEKQKIFRIGADGKATEFTSTAGYITRLRAGPKGRIYFSEELTTKQAKGKETVKERINRVGAKGKREVVVDDFTVNDFVVTAQGKVYCLGAAKNGQEGAYLIDESEPKRLAMSDEAFALRLALTADKGTMVVDTGDEQLWAFRVEADGDLKFGQPYYALRAGAPGAGSVDVDDLTVDRSGRVYALTSLGVQIFDPTGRLCGVLKLPDTANDQSEADKKEDEDDETHLMTFGGPDFDRLYLSIDNKLFVRKVKAQGVAPPK